MACRRLLRGWLRGAQRDGRAPSPKSGLPLRVTAPVWCPRAAACAPTSGPCPGSEGRRSPTRLPSQTFLHSDVRHTAVQ